MVNNKYSALTVTPPGETLKATIEACGITQAELARRLGTTEKTVSKLLASLHGITPEMAYKLELVLGTPAEFWTNREMRYRESLAKTQSNEYLKQFLDWPKQFPIKVMQKQKYISENLAGIDLVRALCQFLGIASPILFEELAIAQVAYRKSKTLESKDGALAAWLRRGEMAGWGISCQPYNREGFLKDLKAIRGLTGKDPAGFVPEMTEMCAQNGVAVVFIQDLPGTQVCGSSRWLSPEKAMIQLSLRYKDEGNMWFTFFHEAGHVLSEHHKKDILISVTQKADCKCAAATQAQENVADKFAQDFLIPADEYNKFVGTCVFTVGSVKAFAKAIGISPGIVVGRLQHDGHLKWGTPLNGMKVRYVWANKS